jgi:hypothetical protein
MSKQKQQNNDGIYRVSMALAKDKKRMEIYRKISSSPNSRRVKSDTVLGKITHYVQILKPWELAGWFDVQKTFEINVH